MGPIPVSLSSVLVVTRFDVPEGDGAAFLPRAQAALAAFAARPGYVRGRIGRAADDPTAWVLTTEWDSVGAYRRSLSAYDVKVDAAPLLSLGRDEPSAFEVLHADDATVGGGATTSGSRRAADAARTNVGESSGPGPYDVAPRDR
jgi:quinol monooxygenase YgiN